ncbi:MAG TPA: hypothetical protein VE093_40440 [Polyangiaceae bacterium]|nr:hypothetical protein [Polyangiaceae bacterium]
MRSFLLSFALLQATAIAALAAGCGDGGGSSNSGGGGDDGSGGDVTSTSGGPGGVGGSGSGGSGGAPACKAETLAEAVRTTSIAITGSASGRAITAEAGAGSVVAWAGQDGKVHVTPLDAEDQRAGEDLVVDGSEVFGAAATGSDVALLVSRPPDFMTFVRVDMKGAELAKVDLVGGGDHAQVGVEWFGEFAQTGRLVAQKDGTYAAYHALHRRWPDNIGHQGDTLRLLDASGGAIGGWGWGCSHSLDQRLAVGPNGLVPICISDCYPGKGIYFNHQASEITSDPGANCAGGYSTKLGGLVASDAGFFLVYKDAQGVSHLGAFDTSGKSTSDRVLGGDGSSRLARYGSGMLLGALNEDGASLQELDASGQDVGAPALISTPLPDQDFEGRTDGEVAWASASGTNLSVVRVRLCD